jgi:hypothetical protein
MSYDQVGPSGQREEYGPWGAETSGSGGITHQIIGPKGCVGFVRDILYEVTTSLIGTTTVPEIQVGISSGDSTFGRYRLGTSAIVGYNTGMHRAGDEQLVVALTNAGRQLADFAGHVVLDGGTYTTISVPGGSASVVAPSGRIPFSGYTVTSVVNGTGNVVRLYLQQQIDVLLKVGQLVQVLNVQGATGVPATATAISAISTTLGYIELSGTTFGGTYTGGGVVNIVVTITELPGSGGTQTNNAGYLRVQCDWQGATGM